MFDEVAVPDDIYQRVIRLKTYFRPLPARRVMARQLQDLAGQVTEFHLVVIHAVDFGIQEKFAENLRKAMRFLHDQFHEATVLAFEIQFVLEDLHRAGNGRQRVSYLMGNGRR